MAPASQEAGEASPSWSIPAPAAGRAAPRFPAQDARAEAPQGTEPPRGKLGRVGGDVSLGV